MAIEKYRIIWCSQLAAIFGGFALLLCEIRFEHRAVLIDDWRPWLPLAFCATMLLLIPAVGLIWHRGGKYVLPAAYGITMCLGLFGLFFHSQGHILQSLVELFSVWSNDLQTGAAIKAEHPPLLAPLAFVGLGTIGLLFSVETPVEIYEAWHRNKSGSQARQLNNESLL